MVSFLFYKEQECIRTDSYSARDTYPLILMCSYIVVSSSHAPYWPKNPIYFVAALGMGAWMTWHEISLCKYSEYEP